MNALCSWFEEALPIFHTVITKISEGINESIKDLFWFIISAIMTQEGVARVIISLQMRRGPGMRKGQDSPQELPQCPASSSEIPHLLSCASQRDTSYPNHKDRQHNEMVLLSTLICTFSAITVKSLWHFFFQNSSQLLLKYIWKYKSS